MESLGKDEDTCEDREHWGGWRILRQMKSLEKVGARHCEISICTCFSLDSELVPKMENAKADTSASEIQGFCDPGSALLRLDTASLPFWNSCEQAKNSHLQGMKPTTGTSHLLKLD